MTSFFKLFHSSLSIFQCIDRFKNLEREMILLKFGGMTMPKLEEEEFPEDDDSAGDDSDDEY